MKAKLWKFILVGAITLALCAMSTNDAAAQLPRQFDTDGDMFYDQLENVLGSVATDSTSTPESHVVDGSCTNFRDDDGDGLTDSADPGCTADDLTIDLTPGKDFMKTTAMIPADMFGQGMPPENLSMAGPVGIVRKEPNGNTLPVEIVAMQLQGTLSDGTTVFQIENPNIASNGEVSSSNGAPPFRSFFDINAVFIVGDRVIPQEPLRVENPEIERLPPVQDSRKVDPDKCYKFAGAPGGLHCPVVPVLRIPVLKYVAKFDCGEQPSTAPPFLEAVEPGNYATKIVIYNPHGKPISSKKKVSQGQRNPKTGPVSAFESFDLKSDGTTEVDCPDIYRILWGKQAYADSIKYWKEYYKHPTFINGVVVIISEKKLDVIANYTYELAKEEIEFKIKPPRRAPYDMRALRKKRLKLVTLVHQEVIIDEEAEVRRALEKQFPPEYVRRTRIKIVGGNIGVGSSIDIESIRPQKCILVDPPALPEGQLECEAEDS